jgi:mRNA-degrading endonuclease RelE of RelBE toxin-antitoxin system
VKFKATLTFAQAFKKLTKKYHNLPQDIEHLRLILTTDPYACIALGAGLYKIRLTSSNIAKGKSDAFRIIYYFMTTHDTIVLTCSGS